MIPRHTLVRAALAARRLAASRVLAPPATHALSSTAASTAESASSTPGDASAPLGAQGGAPPPLLVYSSAEPAMVMWAARLLAFKAVACGAASVMMLAPYAFLLPAMELTSPFTPADVAAAVLHSSDARAGAVLAAMALLAGAVSSRITARTVVKLELVRSDDGRAASAPNAAAAAANAGVPPRAGFSTGAAPGPPLQPAELVHCGDDTVVITRPRLWGGGTRSVRVRRRDISCAPANTTFQCFQLAPNPLRPRTIPQYLFPVRGSVKSDDLAYLKTLMFGDFFRPEPPLPAASSLIAIEGFGPYRPAQFADARHPLFPTSLPVSAARAPVAGTPFFTQHGDVWGTFTSPPVASMAARRAAERDAKLYGADAVPARALPSIAAPASLQLDGSTRVVTYGEVAAHLAAARRRGEEEGAGGGVEGGGGSAAGVAGDAHTVAAAEKAARAAPLSDSGAG